MPGSARSSFYRWGVVGLLFAAQFVAYADRVNISVAAPVLMRSLHFGPSVMGVVLSTFNWSYTLVILLAGPLADAVGARWAYTLGVGIWSVGTWLTALAALGLTPFLAFRALVGIGEAPLFPAGIKVIGQNNPRGERTLAVGAFTSGNKIGLAVGTALSTVLLVRFGWHSVFYVTGGLGLIWLVAWLTVYRDPPRESPRRDQGSEVKTSWLSLLAHRSTWGLVIGEGGWLYVFYVFVSWLPGYLVLQRHMTVLRSGFAASLLFLTGFLANPLGGWVADVLIRRGSNPIAVRKTITSTGLLFCAAFALMAASASSTSVAMAMLFLSFTSLTATSATAESLPIELAPAGRVASLSSLQNFGGNFVGSFAPFLTGAILAATHSFYWALIVAAGFSVLGAACFALLVQAPRAVAAEVCEG